VRYTPPVTSTKNTLAAQPAPATAKFAERRAELAEAALKTLAELGYARTSLREIAQNTAFSHGVLHYYFKDKVDLIMCCVRQYKARCVTRYDETVATATSADELAHGFAETMAQTIVDEGTLHRLWYDLRVQSLFEPSFREDVRAIDDSLQRMVWRVVLEHAKLRGSTPNVTPALAYALFDGVFQRSLMGYLHGRRGALAELKKQVVETLGGLANADQARSAAGTRSGSARKTKERVAARRASSPADRGASSSVSPRAKPRAPRIASAP
jgi:AcrR family transcriptional regulator